MKIDKVIFSCSEAFSIFWNLNSKIYKTKIGVEPVCLLYGKKENTDMSDEFGTIIEMPIIERFPLLIQITWSKFYYPVNELDTTWLIGDIDLMPLQSYWFINKIKDINDTNYVHLDADGITQLSGHPFKWSQPFDIPSIPMAIQKKRNLPGHYHLAKGNIFKKVLKHDNSFSDILYDIVNSGKYNGTRGFRDSDPIEQHNLWGAEEKRSTEMIKIALTNAEVNFTGFSIKHGLGRAEGERIDRSTLRSEENGTIMGQDYLYELQRLRNNEYVDLHCARPFLKYKQQTENVLKIANMI